MAELKPRAIWCLSQVDFCPASPTEFRLPVQGANEQQNRPDCLTGKAKRKMAVSATDSAFDHETLLLAHFSVRVREIIH